jgi:hypothetical protein
MYPCQNLSLPIIRFKDNHIFHNLLNYKIHSVRGISKYFPQFDVYGSSTFLSFASLSAKMSIFEKASKMNAACFEFWYLCDIKVFFSLREERRQILIVGISLQEYRAESARFKSF